MTMSTAEKSGPNSRAPSSLPKARQLEFDAPWNWLAAGWRDIWVMPGLSLGYGVLVFLASWALFVLLQRLDALAMVLVLAGGFLLIGPLLAVGLYRISQRLEAGAVSLGLSDILLPPRAARGQLAFFGVLLLLFFSFWVRFAGLLASIFLGGVTLPPLDKILQTLLFTPEGLGLLMVGTASGAVLAALVFALTAFAVPMLLERETDAFSASRASFTAVLANLKPMLLWAALIVVMIAAGIATAFVGLIFAFPLIGHASWHAYRDAFGAGGK